MDVSGAGLRRHPSVSRTFWNLEKNLDMTEKRGGDGEGFCLVGAYKCLGG